MIELDSTDISILKLVQKDSRITIKEMAARLHLSTTPIFERLKRLERRGVIAQYVALLDPKKIGKKLTVFVHISVVDHSMQAIDSFVEHVEEYPEVMECYHITGDSDFILKVVVEDIERYNDFVSKKLSTVQNIGRLKSSFSLSVRKWTTAHQMD